MLLDDSISTCASSCASIDRGTCTAIWSPSKSALKAVQTSGWISIALPSTRIGSKAWMPSRWSDRKSTRLNSSHSQISYAVFCLKKTKPQRCHRPYLTVDLAAGRLVSLRGQPAHVALAAAALPRQRDDLELPHGQAPVVDIWLHL